MFYNNERKEEFLATSETPIIRKFNEGLLKKFSKYENDVWHEDMCLQSADKLAEAVGHISGYRNKSVLRVYTLIRQYVTWCKNQGYETNDDALNIGNVDVSNKVLEYMVGSPLGLQKKLDEVFHKEDKQTIDVVYRTYFWFAFAGIGQDDIFDITIDEVDLENLVVQHKNKFYQLYIQAKKAIELACDLDEVRYIHPLYDDKILKRSVGNKVMRGVKSKSIKKSSLTSYLSKLTRSKHVKLSYRDVYQSGMFYRVEERERAGYPIDFSAIAREQFYSKQRDLSNKSKVHRLLKSMEREIEKDYLNWKKTFLYMGDG